MEDESFVSIFLWNDSWSSQWVQQIIVMLCYTPWLAKLKQLLNQKNCLFCVQYYTTNGLLKVEIEVIKSSRHFEWFRWMTRKKLKTNRNAKERTWRPVGRYWGAFWSIFSMACDSSSALYSIPKHLITSRFGHNMYLLVFSASYIHYYSSQRWKVNGKAQSGGLHFVWRIDKIIIAFLFNLLKVNTVFLCHLPYCCNWSSQSYNSWIKLCSP